MEHLAVMVVDRDTAHLVVLLVDMVQAVNMVVPQL